MNTVTSMLVSRRSPGIKPCASVLAGGCDTGEGSYFSVPDVLSLPVLGPSLGRTLAISRQCQPEKKPNDASADPTPGPYRSRGSAPGPAIARRLGLPRHPKCNTA